MNTQTQLTRLGLFDARVPRYTSYPTAPHFGRGDPALFGRLDPAIPGVVHIALPACAFLPRLCWFCACRTQGTSSDEPVRAYTETLKQEIALLKAHLPPGVRLSRLHWGGGTPTLLPTRHDPRSGRLRF
jgi:oxygen-independent coproporphyrinogen III oxidase